MAVLTSPPIFGKERLEVLVCQAGGTHWCDSRQRETGDPHDAAGLPETTMRT